MYYVLSQEEYDKVLQDIRDAETAKKETIQRLCSQVCDILPIKDKYRPDDDPHPWGCILTEGPNCGYCDQCPVQDDCPSKDKNWSK